MNDFGPPDQLRILDDPSRLVCTVSRDGRGAARARAQFADWLWRHFWLDERQLSDLILAVNEALADTVTFSSSGLCGDDTVDIVVAYHDDTDTLVVTVTAGGRTPGFGDPPRNRHRNNGRASGAVLMRLLADQARIDPAEHGSRISLMWTNLQGQSKTRTTQLTAVPEQLAAGPGCRSRARSQPTTPLQSQPRISRSGMHARGGTRA